MTVKNSRYTELPYQYVGTVLGSVTLGTVIAPPSDGARLRLDYVAYWLVDPATAGTVTLSLGDVDVPAVGLSSSRTAASFDSHVFEPETGMTVAITGAGSIAFFGKYLTATDD